MKKKKVANKTFYHQAYSYYAVVINHDEIKKVNQIAPGFTIPAETLYKKW